MTSSAHICYQSKTHSVNLRLIAEIIKSETKWTVSDTQWSGFGLVIPQLLVQTPIPFLIQIVNDPEWVPAEILEFGKWAGIEAGSEIHSILSQCDSRLAIQSTNPDQAVTDGSSITVFTLGTAVDPRDPEISIVLASIGHKLNGILHDCVNGGISKL